MIGSVDDVVLADKVLLLEAALRASAPVAVAFSGGVDSSLLYHEARRVLGSDAVAAIGVSESLGREELEHARGICAEIGGRLLEIQTRELDREGYRANAGLRCYHCKTELFARLVGRPELAEYSICDGNNADDLALDRPGMAAGREQGVLSPLRDAQLGKAEIRTLARRRGLSVWNRPARPCLASRIRVGTLVDGDRLAHVEELERILARWGFRVYRARIDADTVSVELGDDEFHRRVETEWRAEFSLAAKRLGYRQAEASPTPYPGRAD